MVPGLLGKNVFQASDDVADVVGVLDGITYIYSVIRVV